MFVYKHTETIEYIKNYPTLKKVQDLWRNNSRIFKIKNARFSGYYFCKSYNILGYFQI